MRYLTPICLVVLVSCASTSYVLTDSNGSVRAWLDSQPPPLASTVDIVNYAKPATAFIRHRDESGNQTAGTGFLVHQDGLVITCAHVVERNAPKKPKCTDKIWVRTYDGTVHEAAKWRVLPDSDVALLKINVTGYPYLDVETSVPKLGEEIIVIGYPLGQALGTEPTVTKGIISAVRFSNSAYQLDAAINPGNSGGPVLNKTGDALGVVSFKIRGAEGMAFAVSARLFPLNPSRDGHNLAGLWGNSEMREMGARIFRGAHIEHNTRPLLFRAADSGDPELARKQLAAGAKVDMRDGSGQTPLLLAARVSANADKEDPSYRARKLRIAELLIQAGADVNATDRDGRTALHGAAYDFPECVRLLVEHGAKVNAQDNLVMETPLWCACVVDNIDSAELLIKNGADVNARGREGQTILGFLLYMAARPGYNDGDLHHHDKMIALLRRHGGTE